jgi:uncharacterized radical SAM superfamily protein
MADQDIYKSPEELGLIPVATKAKSPMPVAPPIAGRFPTTYKSPEELGLTPLTSITKESIGYKSPEELGLIPISSTPVSTEPAIAPPATSQRDKEGVIRSMWDWIWEPKGNQIVDALGLPDVLKYEGGRWAKEIGESTKEAVSTFAGEAAGKYTGALVGGVGRFITDLLYSQTAPAMLALTIGTWGGGLGTAAGEAALRDVAAGAASKETIEALGKQGVAAAARLFTNDEIGEIARGAQIAEKAMSLGRSVPEALSSAGINPRLFTEGRYWLRRIGLDLSDLRNRGLIINGLGAILRSARMPLTKADTIAKTIQGLTDLGFSTNMILGAIYQYPQFRKALSEDPAQALEMAPSILGNIGLGVAAGFQARAHLRPEVGALAEKFGIQNLIPSEEAQKTRQMGGEFDRKVTEVNRTADLFRADKNKTFKDVNPEDRFAAFLLRDRGEDKEALQRDLSLFKESAGRATAEDTERLRPRAEIYDPNARANQEPILKSVDATLMATSGSLDIRQGMSPELREEAQKNIDTVIHRIRAGRPIDPIEIYRDAEGNIVGVNGRYALQAYKDLGFEHIPVLEMGRTDIRPDLTSIHEEMDKRKLEVAGRRLVSTKYTPEEIDRIIKIYEKSINPTARIRELAKLSENEFAADLANAALHDIHIPFIEDYITRIWGKDTDNQAVNRFVHEIRNYSEFHTNISMLNHRIIDDTVLGMLLGKKLLITDPIELMANYKARLGEAIAAREFVADMIDRGNKTSDGRPIAAYSGSGKVVEMPNGENPFLLIDGRRIRDIRIAAKEIEARRKEGTLDKAIKNGDIVVRFPKLAPPEEAVPKVEKPLLQETVGLEPVTDKFRQQIKDAWGMGLTDEQVEGGISLARAFARMRGVSLEEYWRERGLEGFERGTEEHLRAAGIPRERWAGVKGMADFQNDGKVIIRAMQGADFSTLVHEMFHVFRRGLPEEDLRILENWAGVKNGTWTVDAEEKTARALESHLITGRTYVPEMAGVFAKFKRWMRDIYDGLRNPSAQMLKIPLPPFLEEIFGRIGRPRKEILNPHEAISDLVQANNGATFNLYRGNMGVSGEYAVSIYPENEYTIKLDHKPTAKEVQGFIASPKIIGLLRDPSNNVGVWYDKDAKQWIMEVSVTVPDIGQAMMLGKKYNQQGIVHLDGKNYPFISTGGTGIKPGDAAWPNPEDRLGEMRKEQGRKFEQQQFNVLLQMKDKVREEAGVDIKGKRPSIILGPVEGSSFIFPDGRSETVPLGHPEWLTEHGYTDYEDAFNAGLIRIMNPGDQHAGFVGIQFGRLNPNTIEQVSDALTRLKTHPNSPIGIDWNVDREGYGHLAYRNLAEANDSEFGFRKQAMRKLARPNDTLLQGKDSIDLANIPLSAEEIRSREGLPDLKLLNIDGSDISNPNYTYKEASADTGNPWIRRSVDTGKGARETGNAHRTLLVQISNKLINPESSEPRLPEEVMESRYYDKLYDGSRPGYKRLDDFWEIPQWMGFASNFIPDADAYVIRSLSEAKDFLSKAGYGRIAFSALDVNRDMIRNIASAYKGHIDVGGYSGGAEFFKDLPNVKWHDNMASLARDMGVPYKEGVDYRHFKESGQDVIPRLTMSTGCLHKCAFCTIEKRIEMPSPEAINQQADAIGKLGSRLVYLNDKTFGQAPNYEMLPELYNRIKDINPDFGGFIIQTTAAQANKFSIDWLKKSGIRFAEIGVETYNNDLLKELHKPATEQLIDKAAARLKEADIALIPNIMIGLPGETAESMARTVDWLQKNADNISHANIYNTAVYEGTELAKKLTTASEADFDENALEKSWADTTMLRNFAGKLYGLASQMLNSMPESLKRRLPAISTDKLHAAATKGAEFLLQLAPDIDITTLHESASPLEKIVNEARERYALYSRKLAEEIDPRLHHAMGEIYKHAQDLIDESHGAERYGKQQTPTPSGIDQWEWNKLSPHYQKLYLAADTADKAMPEQLKAAALVGAGGRFWYDRYLAGFQKIFNPEDFPIFTKLLAAISPRKAVKTDLIQALQIWGDWNDKGRPADRKSITDIAHGRAIESQKIGTDLAGSEYYDDYRDYRTGEPRPYKVPDNIMSTLSEWSDLSGPKVSAFFANLMGNNHRATIDTWMQLFKGQKPFDYQGRPHEYLLYQAQLRNIAKDLNWTPSQAQASVWIFMRTLAELSGLDTASSKPLDFIVKQMESSPDIWQKELKAQTTDLVELLATDKEVRDALTGAGIDPGVIENAERAAKDAVTRIEEGSVEKPDIKTLQDIATRIQDYRTDLEKNRAAKADSILRLRAEIPKPITRKPYEQGWIIGNDIIPIRKFSTHEQNLKLSSMLKYGLGDTVDSALEKGAIKFGKNGNGYWFEAGKFDIAAKNAIARAIQERFGDAESFSIFSGKSKPFITSDPIDAIRALRYGMMGEHNIHGRISNELNTEAYSTPRSIENIPSNPTALFQESPAWDERDQAVKDGAALLWDHPMPMNEWFRQMRLRHNDAIIKDPEIYADSLRHILKMAEKSRPEDLKNIQKTAANNDTNHLAYIARELARVELIDPRYVQDRVDNALRAAGYSGRYNYKEPKGFVDFPTKPPKLLFQRMGIQESITGSGWISPSGKFKELPEGSEHPDILPERFGTGEEASNKAIDRGYIRIRSWKSDNAPDYKQWNIETSSYQSALDTLNRLPASPDNSDIYISVLREIPLEEWEDRQYNHYHGTIKDITRKLINRANKENILLQEKGGPISGEEMALPPAIEDKTQRLTGVPDNPPPKDPLDATLQRPKGDPIYLYNTHDYMTIDHPAFRHWNWAAYAPDGTPVLVKGDVRVHPDVYQYVTRRLGLEQSPLRGSAVGRAVLGLGTQFKQILLSLSPFHISQLGLRSLMSGVIPRLVKWDLKTDPDLAMLVEQSMTLGHRFQAESDFSEGLSASGTKSILLRKMPGIRDAQNWLQEFTFERLMPSLKAMVGKKLFGEWRERFAKDPKLYERYLQAHPDFSGLDPIRAAARAAAIETNERFGGLNYRDMGRSVGTQDWFRLVTLAPDWLESEVRLVKRLFDPTGGKLLRRDMAYFVGAMWVTARAVNMLVNNGQAHPEAPFGIVTEDKEGHKKVWSMRTLPGDMFHMADDPVGFMRGRASPTMRMATSLYSGRDALGRKLTPWQQTMDVVRNVMPISLQYIGKSAAGEMPAEIPSWQQGLRGAGIIPTPLRSEAESKAIQLATNRTEEGPVDEAALRKHQLMLEYEDQLRKGEISQQDLHQMVEDGQIPLDEAKRIVKEIRTTGGMDPALARLYLRCSRLAMPDFLQVWDLMTSSEKTSLSALMLQKKKAYQTKALKKMTPAERKADPTYQWILRTFPGSRPWEEE